MLPRFAALGKFDIKKFDCDPTKDKIKEAFILNKAVYHKNCYSKYNQRMLDRESLKIQTQSAALSQVICSPENKRARRSEVGAKVMLGDLKCMFCKKNDKSENICAAGTFHAKSNKNNEQHVRDFTEKVKRMSIYLDKMDIHSLLSSGDVASNELFYHSSCYKSLINQYNSTKRKLHKSSACLY